MGSRLVAVTLGADGAEVFTKRENVIKKISAPAFHLPIVDTIGAGDSFHGAFLSWLEEHGRMSRKALDTLNENEIREALLFSNKAAAIVCSKKGAEPPTLAEIEAL